MKLKIVYTSENGVKELLDKVLRATLEKMGFEEIGSGYLFETKERDLSFENKREK